MFTSTRDQPHFIPVYAQGVVAISAPIWGNFAFQALPFQLGQGTHQGQSPALLGIWCPTGASPGRNDLTLNLSCFILEGIPHSAFLGLLCLLLKFALPLKVSLVNVSMLSAAKCLFGKSREQEQPQRSRRWKLYLAGMGLTESLEFKNHKNVLFFPS